MSGDAPGSSSDSKDAAIVVYKDPSGFLNKVLELDPEIEKKIDNAVKDIILLDNERIAGDPEIILALRDYVRAEAVCQIVFNRITKGDSDKTGDERLFRACMTIKNTIRDEIWGKSRGKKRRGEEVEKVKSILIDQKIIEAKKETDVVG